MVKKGVKSPKKAFKATFVVKVEKELLLCYSLQHWLGTELGRGGSEAHMPQPPPQRSSAEKRGGGGAPHTPEKLAYFSSLAHMKGLLYRWLLIHTLYTYLFQLSEKKITHKTNAMKFHL